MALLVIVWGFAICWRHVLGVDIRVREALELDVVLVARVDLLHGRDTVNTCNPSARIEL